METPWRLPFSKEMSGERASSRKGWIRWFRQDFLRSCFVGGSFAWDGFGAVAVRYAFDPYHPGQEAAPATVYAIILAFVLGSIALQVYLYRRLWPIKERRRPLLGIDASYRDPSRRIENRP